MITQRLLPAALLIAAAAAWGQLPPALVQPGHPPAPVPAAPANPAPTVPGAAIFPSAPELPPNPIPNTLSPEETAQGWRLLFDGQRLLGLRGLQKSDPLAAGWKIRAGAIELPKEIRDMEKMTGGDLITLDLFWDFDFRFEWRATASADSGIRYMLGEAIGQTLTGLEYQIIDDVHNSASLKGGVLRRSGALDNILPVGSSAKLRSADPLNKTGDPWNEGRILVRGNHVEHWMNGDKVLEFELGPALRQAAVAHKMKVPAFFGMKTRTRICILDQGFEIAFRNLKVRPLVPQATTAPVQPGTAQPGRTAPNPLLLPGKGATGPGR